MNKIEANISLFIITFFVAVQYIFLAGVPEDLSHFAFLCITNLIGFVMIFAFFFGELFRLDVRQIFQSAILSSELIGFNLFMLMGLRDVDPAITSAVLSSYFVFVLLLDAILKRKFPNKLSIISVLTVLTGLLLMTNADIKGLFNIGILYLLIADVFFAIYVINVGSYAKSSNPSILAMGQMFFCFVFSLILWGGEAVLTGIKFSLPTNKDFWVGVIYISFFIRGLYAIIQIYAQRYVSPLNTSLIFSSEIVMTMIISPLISKIFDTATDAVTP
ncbi:MAG: DMT family transporter, partial [Synergistaceae bacterium]|nr:DMT family transporter [Synergistaceae bacterium]